MGGAWPVLVRRAAAGLVKVVRIDYCAHLFHLGGSLYYMPVGQTWARETPNLRTGVTGDRRHVVSPDGKNPETCDHGLRSSARACAPYLRPIFKDPS